MPTTTTTYSFNKPVVGADEDDWGGYLNGNWDSVDDLLDGTTPVTGIDINSGTLDGVTIGGTTAGAGTFTTLTANTSITGTLATAAQPNITSVGSLTSLDVAGAITSDGLTVDTDTLHVDSTNNRVGIGTGSPKSKLDFGLSGSVTATPSSSYSDYAIALYGSTTSGSRRNVIGVGEASAVAAGIGFIDTGSGGAQGVTFNTGNLTSTTESMRISSNGDISFYEDTGTTAKFFWDASAESLGIGTTSPAAPLEVSTSTADYRIQLTHAFGQNKIKSVDGDQSTFRNLFYDAAQHFFEIGGSEAMRIDSSGNLLVGHTNRDTTVSDGASGATIGYDGFIGSSRLGSLGEVMVLNREDSDGSILSFRKDGATVGSIGTNGGDLFIGTGDTGIRFKDDTDDIRPWNTSTNALTDGTIDLGDGIARFKNLYLSGGVYLGGTGAANKLDDYEEGTWTISFLGATITPSNSTGYYTKVGNKVFVFYYSGLSTITGASGSARFSGLPFTVDSGSFKYSPFMTTHNTYFGGSATVGTSGFFNQNTTQCNFVTTGITSSSTYTNGTGKYIMLSGFYQTAS